MSAFFLPTSSLSNLLSALYEYFLIYTTLIHIYAAIMKFS